MSSRSWKIKVDDLAIVMSFLMLKTTFFLNNNTCAVMSIMVLFYIASHFKAMIKQNRTSVAGLTLIYVAIALLSTFINRRGHFLNHIQNILCLIELMAVLRYNVQKSKNRTISIICKCCGLYLIINLLMFVLFPRGIARGVEVTWLLPSGKFSSAYLSIIYLCLLMTRYPEKKALHFWGMGVGLLTTIHMGCTTGIVAIFFILLIYFLPEKVKDVVINWRTVIISFVVLNGGLVVTQTLLSNSIVQNFIQYILHESTTLTGRIQIYAMIFDVIAERIWLGYGYGNDVVISFLGYGNAQNGLLQLALNYGMLGTVVFAITLILLLRNDKADPALRWGLSAFIICAVVEVTFSNTYFYLILALIYSLYSNTVLDKAINEID